MRELGISPVTAARVLRFDAARRTIGADTTPRFADVAAEHGYADQAHLARDFRGARGLHGVGVAG